MQNVSKNLLLQSLPENVSELLGRHLRKALLPSQSVIYEPGDIPAEVYFPETAAISLVVVFSNGTFAEAAMVGRDGMLGGFSTLHDQRVAYRAVVQIKGLNRGYVAGYCGRVMRAASGSLLQHRNL